VTAARAPRFPDPDPNEIIALRAAISQLIIEITVGLADPA